MRKLTGLIFLLPMIYTTVAQIPSPLGCFKVDKGSPVFYHSAGDYDPAALTPYACASACTAQRFTFASLEGNACLCSDANYPVSNLQADDTNCASTCTGDVNEKCGNSDYSIVYDVSTAPAAVQLAKNETSISYVVGVAKSAPVVTEGTELLFEFDYGDGTPVTQLEPHIYGVPGQYIVTATAENLKGQGSDAVVVEAEMEVDRAEMVCPIGVSLSVPFWCTLEIYEGYNIDAAYNINAGAETWSSSLGSPTFSSVGTCAQSAAIVTPQVDAASDVAWVIPDAEFKNEGRVLAFEAFISDIGTNGQLDFLILRPTCSVTDVWCPPTNTCGPTCDWTSSNGDPLSFQTCSASNLYCPDTGVCVSSGDPFTYPTQPSRTATLATDSARVDYTVVASVTRTVVAGYNYLKLDDIVTSDLPAVETGDVLGFKTTSTGARVGYESFVVGDSSVEFAYAGAVTSEGSLLAVAQSGTGVTKTHHVGAVLSHPIIDTFEHVFNSYGDFQIEASLTNSLTQTPIVPFARVGVFSVITGLNVSVTPAWTAIGGSATVMILVASGSPVNYTIDWGDGSTEWVLRQATTYDTTDDITHTYSTQDGTLTINVTASNLLSTMSEETTITVLEPINRAAFAVSSDSPVVHPCFPCATPPGTVEFTFTVIADPIGTNPLVSISSGTQGNVTDIPLNSLQSINDFQTVEHSFRFPGVYDIHYKIYNQISEEEFLLDHQVSLQTAILGFTINTAYLPEQASPNAFANGHGPNRDYFPSSLPVTFILEAGSGTGVTIEVTAWGDGSPTDETVFCQNMDGCRLSHQYTSAGTYTVTMAATNDVSTMTASTTITVNDDIKCISVSDTSIGTGAGDVKTLQVDISSEGTDSCLVVDFQGDGSTLQFYGNQATCADNAFYDVASWVSAAIPASPFILSHTYPADGTYTCTITGFNTVSETIVEVPVAITSLDCTVPTLSIDEHHANVAFPKRYYKNQAILLEVFTNLYPFCPVIDNDKRWKIEHIDTDTGGVLTQNYLDEPPYDLIDARTAAIRIRPRVLDYGVYKLTLDMTLDSASTNNVLLTNSISQYIEVVKAPLIVRLLDGQTTSTVVGYGDTLDLNPEMFSSDPNIAEDGDQGFHDATFKFYCKRFYENYKLDDNMDFDETPVVIPEIGADIEVDQGGCYSTGPGRLDHDSGPFQLRTIGMQVNMTHEIMVIVTKGDLQGKAKLKFTVKPGTRPMPVISCSGGTLFETDYGSIVFNPTADMRLQADCSKGCDSDSTVEWSIIVNDGYRRYDLIGWQDHATGVNTLKLWLSREVFAIVPNATFYELTVLMTNEAGYSGMSHILIESNQPPYGGSCNIPSGRTSITVGETLDITCSDWEDDNGIAAYKYYILRDDFFIPITLPIVATNGDGVIHLEPPAGSTKIDYQMDLMVQISDTLGAVTTYTISQIEVFPNATLDVSDASVVENIQREMQVLLAEGNSRDINTKLQTLCSQLNDVNEIEEEYLETLIAANDTEAAATSVSLMEGNKELRAYMRKLIIDLMCQYLNLDSMKDVQLGANSLSVCTAKTDEITQQALDCILELLTTCIDMVYELGEDAEESQETIVTVLKTVIDNLGNAQQATHDLSSKPLTMNDKLEAEGGDFDSLKADIEAARGADDSITTTWSMTTEQIDDVLRQQKAQQLGQKATGLETQIRRAQRYMLKNKLSGEPQTEYKSNTITFRVARSTVNDILGLIQTKDEDGGAVLPSPSTTFANLDLAEGEEIDAEMSSLRQNPRNHDKSSEALADDTEVQTLEFSRPDGTELKVKDLDNEPIEFHIGRKKGQTPGFKSFDPTNNTDPNTGMLCHSVDVRYEGMAIILDFIPLHVSIPYEVYIKYKEFPTLDIYDMVLPLNNDSDLYDSNKGLYSVFLSDDYVANDTGKYVFCIRELTTFEGLNFDYYNETNNFTGPYELRIILRGCRYWNKDLEEWSSDGLTVSSKSNANTTVCLSTHLSSFASAWIVPPTPLDFDYIFANAGFAQNLTIYITTIVVYVLFFFILIWARRKDKKDVVLFGVTPLPDNSPKDKYYYEIVVCTGQRKDAGTDSKVSFILSGDQDETDVRSFEDNMRPILTRSAQDRFLMATRRPLGTLNYMRLWHDNSGVGKNQSWYLQYIAIRDLQTRERFYFIINNWFSLVEGDGEVDRLIPVAGKEQMQSFDHVFYGHTRKNLNDGHIWFSIFARPAGSRFSRCQRAACCMMLLWLEMLVNIMYYKVVPPAPASNALSVGPFSLSPAQVSIGVQSALMVFPVSLLVVQLFRKARPRKKRVSRIEQAKKEQPKQIKLGRDRSKAYVKKDPVSASAIQIEEKSDYHDSSPRSDSNLITEDEPVVNTSYNQPRQKNKKKKASKTCPWWTIIIAWIVVILVTMAATTFTIFYGIQFGNETTSEWLASFVVTTVTGILFTQPIKVIAMAIFIALVIKTPNADEDEDMEEDEEDFELGKDEEWLHSMSDAPARRKIAYIPPDPDHIERMREKRIKEIAMYSIIREIILYIIFLWVLMMISYGNQDAYAYIMKEQYMNTLVGGDGTRTFDKIVTIEQYWAWVHTGLVPNLYAGQWYNGDDPELQEQFFGDRNAFIIGYPVMRQVRVRPDLCDIHAELEDYVNECNVGYSMSSEDEGSYEAGWIPTNLTEGLLRDEYTYTSWDELDGYPFFGKHSVYIGGGYVVKLDDPDTNANKMQQLYEEAWIDRYTRAVFIEFSTYNAQVNLFAVVNLVVEFLPSGGGYPNPRIDVIRLLTYYEGFALVQVCCEVLFFVFLIFFIVKEVKLILKEKRAYPKVFWNLAEWVIIGFSIGLIIVYFYRFYTTKSLISDLKATGGKGYIKLQYVAYWNELLGYMIGWVVFMSTLKFIKLLRFNRRIGVLSSTIRLAANDLVWFAMFFGIIFLAFSVAFYLILGQEVYNYSDFTYTMESLITAILGKFAFKEIVEADRVLGPLLFFLFMGTIAFILINMFLTIITEAFQVVKHDVGQQSNDYEMVDFMMTRLKGLIGLQQATATLNPKDHEDQAKKNAAKDDMDVFAEKVDQLLNHIAKAYFNQENFDDIIKSHGQGKEPAKPKKVTPITA